MDNRALAASSSCPRAAQVPSHSTHCVSIPEQTGDTESLFYFLFQSLCFIFHKSLLFQDLSKYTLIVNETVTSTESHIATLPGTLGKRLCLWTELAGHVRREAREVGWFGVQSSPGLLILVGLP